MTQTKILPFNRDVWMDEADEFRKAVDMILEARPVMNLTEDEAVTTLRFLELKAFLSEGRYNVIVVNINDTRLELCEDSDRFLAVLADCDNRDVLLGTKRCRRLFGGTVYHWRNIARKCPIIETVSALSECSSGYYGRGWKIAPHIERLINWIIKNCDYSKIQKLKG